MVLADKSTVKWTDIEIIIPAVVSIPERADSLKKMLIDLARQCAGAQIHVVSQWRHEKSMTTWRDAFALVSSQLLATCRPWVFFIEDDAEISPNFGASALPVLVNATKNYGAVSFFSSDAVDVERLNSGLYSYDARYPFVYSQCVAIRLEVAKAWGEMMVPWWDAASQGLKRAPDVSLGDCCKDMGLKILVHLPSLVQHREIPSAFGHTRHVKSLTFR